MNTIKIVWFVVLSFSPVIFGISDISCQTTRPLRGSDVTCNCVSPNNIEWKFDDVAFSTCTTAGMCSPTPAGYGFKIDMSNPDNDYNLTVQGFDYGSCGVYSCTDLTTLEEKKVTLSFAVFNSASPSFMDEPGDHQNGIIEITTECLFRETDIIVEWYSIKGNMSGRYFPDASFNTSTDCMNTCNDEQAVRLTIGFNHFEDDSPSKQSVKFGLKVYHEDDRSNVLDLRTQNEYFIEINNETYPETNKDTDNEALEESHIVGRLSWWKILLIILGILVGLFLSGTILGLFILIRQGHRRNEITIHCRC